MFAQAKGRYLRISPFKLRKISRQLSGYNVDNALNVLKTMPHKGAKMAYKVIASAKANFKDLHVDQASLPLSIDLIYVDEGPSFNRWKHRSRGRADKIQKRTAHLTVRVKSED